MKNKFYTVLFSACFVLSFITTANVKAQTTIFYDNFDSVSVVPPNLPTGWVASTPPSGDTSWVTSSTNSSTGYTGASGVNCLDISNGVTWGGTFTLTSKSISTLGYTNVSVIYGARRTTHFSDNGSAISSFDFSTDGGSTWTNIPYIENLGNSTWSLINDSTPIVLPVSAANKASVLFRWTATLVATPSGTYRIDDFKVQGTLANGISEYKDQNAFKVYIDQSKLLHLTANVSYNIPSGCSISVSDITGRICFSSSIVAKSNIYSLADLKQGIYFIRIVANNLLFTQKIVCN